MTTDIERLVVSLEANIKNYERSLAKAMGQTNATARGIERRFEGMTTNVNSTLGNFAKGFVASAVGALGLQQAIVGVRNAVHQVDELGDLSERIGVSTDTIQTIKFSLAQLGGSAEDADRALDKFSDTMAEANLGGGYLAKVFQGNHISLKNLDGSLKTTEELLVIFANLVSNTEGAANRLKLATDGFGRQAGPKMVETLLQIAHEGLPAMTENAKRAGAVIENDLIKKAGDLEKKFVEVETKISNAYKSMVVEWAGPALLKAIDDVASAFKNVALGVDLIKTGRIREALGILTEWERAKQLLTIAGKPLETDQFFEPPKPTGAKTVLPPSGEGKASAFEREIEQLEKKLKLEEEDLRLIDATAGEREQARVTIELQTAAMKDGIPITQALSERIALISHASADMADKMKAAHGPLATFGRDAADVNKQLQEAAVSGLRGFEDALIDIGKQTVTVAEAFKKMAASILQDLARIAIRQGITGPLAGGINSLFTPAPAPAAIGGSVTAGNMLPSSGSLSRQSSGGNITLATTIDARGSDMGEAKYRAILAEHEVRIKRDIVPIVRDARSRRML